MDNPFEAQLKREIKKVFMYTLYDVYSCEVLTCTEEEIPQIINKYIFIRMDYSIPAFRTPEFAMESIK